MYSKYYETVTLFISISSMIQWRIQDFPEGVRQPQRGASTYYLTKFPRKLHENEEMLTQRGGARPSHPL